MQQRIWVSDADYAAGVCCHASWAFGAMQFAPSLQLSEMFCSAVTVVLTSPGSSLTVQQICAFLWGIARVAKLQESSNRRSIGNRMVDTYGGKGSGWQRAAGPAMPDSAQMWQEIIMPALRAAQQPIADELARHQPHHARVGFISHSLPCRSASDLSITGHVMILQWSQCCYMTCSLSWNAGTRGFDTCASLESCNSVYSHHWSRDLSSCPVEWAKATTCCGTWVVVTRQLKASVGAGSVHAVMGTCALAAQATEPPPACHAGACSCLPGVLHSTGLHEPAVGAAPDHASKQSSLP